MSISEGLVRSFGFHLGLKKEAGKVIPVLGGLGLLGTGAYGVSKLLGDKKEQSFKKVQPIVGGTTQAKKDVNKFMP